MQWSPGGAPAWRSTWASYDGDLSTRDSVKCRSLLKSTWYQETFRPPWTFAADQDEKTYFVNTAKGFRVSTSVGGKGTGWRGNLIAADDALNAKERHSEPALREVIDWWTNVVFNRLNDMATDNKLVIMQRLVSRDLAGDILRRGGYEYLMIPMEYDPSGAESLRCARKQNGVTLAKPARLCVRRSSLRTSLTSSRRTRQNHVGFAVPAESSAEGGGILKPHKWNTGNRPACSFRRCVCSCRMGSISEREAVELPAPSI